MTVIAPTHNCFDDAADYLNAVALGGDREELERVRLAHGIIRFPDDQPNGGRRAAHAWVEDGDAVIDAGLLDGQRVNVLWPRHEFYRRLRVEAVTYYTARELVDHNDAQGHVGPWRADLRALLRTPADRTTAAPYPLGDDHG